MVNPLARLWTDRMTVVEAEQYAKENGAQGFRENVVLKDVPCKLSFSNLEAASENEGHATIAQAVRLFCDASLVIKAGSKIIVNRRGKAYEYRRSGEPAVFTRHQEIPLAAAKVHA